MRGSWAFLVDEDLPHSTTVVLRQAGYPTRNVREAGLRGRSDADVFAFAQACGATLITADKGFANILSFPLGSHAGLIVVRVPNELPTHLLNERILHVLAELQSENLYGSLIIVEIGRTRIRRPPAANGPVEAGGEPPSGSDPS